MKIFALCRPLPLLLLCALFFCGKALAVNCYYINGYSVRSATITFPAVTVQRDAAEGSILATIVSSALHNIDQIIQCDGVTGNLIMRFDGAGIPTYTWNGETYFSTGIQGIGIKMTSNSERWQPDWHGGSLPIRHSGGQCESLWWDTDPSKSWYRFCGQSWGWNGHVFQLVKTGPVTGTGTISAGTLVRTSIEGYLDSFFFNLAPSDITTASCTVKTPNVAVTLDPMQGNHFTSPGATTGDKHFTIDLDCIPETRINATLSGAQNSETDDDSVLALTGAGTAGVASGVGIQLLYNNAPLRLNQYLRLKTSSGGQEFPPDAFSARYYQTRASVTPGDANTTATLNLTYQ